MKRVVCFLITFIMLLVSLNLTAFAASELNITPIDSSKHIKIDSFTKSNAELATELKGKGLTNVKWGSSSSKVHQILPVQTDRGSSLEIEAIVYTGANDGTSSKNPTEEMVMPGNGVTKIPTRSELLYTQCLMEFSTIKTTVYFKSSLRFPDANFNNAYLSLANDWKAFAVVPNGSVTTFNGRDTGLTFKQDTWFDIEGVFDCDTGYYAISISDGEKSFSGTGVVARYTPGTGIYRLSYCTLNRIPANDWSKPTSMYVDDIQVGTVDKLTAPVSSKFDFSDSTVPAAFTTTGGTAAISGGALSISGTADAETVSAMALPFDNTKFVYTADVTVSDLTADRSLMAGSVELAKLGADQKLYIGGTAVDGVTLTTGTYSVKVVADQTNHTATVSVANGSSISATQNVSLGSSAVNLATLDWKIAAAADTVTTLDNVTVNTLYTFGVDALTSVSGKTILAADDVEVKFTNPIDMSTFNSNTVKINDGAVALGSISQVDDYTVKIAFEKEPNGTYEIDFTNVKDIVGNTSTTSVTVYTERQDLVMSDVLFSRGGQPLEVASAGTVTATFDAKAYNGNSYEALYMLGLYKGGHLTDCVYDTVSIGSTKQSYPLSITIPNDGYYVLKAFVWDKATLKPFKDVALLKALKDDDKVALVKFDDLNTNNVDRFATIAEWAEDNDIDMNFIFMVDYFDPEFAKGALCDEEDLAKLKAMYESDSIELTSHSYARTDSFYGNATLAEQLADFDKVTEVMGKQGITITSMAPPNNAVNADTRTALNANPEYKVVMVKASNNATLNSNGFFNNDNSFVTLWKAIDVESSATGGTGHSDTLANLKTMWNAAMDKGYEYVLLQAHPGSWTDGCDSEQNTYNFLLWLKSQGVKFMKATEYAEYLMSL